MGLAEALAFAEKYHSNKFKKGTEVLFIYHPMAVASMVFKYGGTEAQAQAAILHDTIGEGTVSREHLISIFGVEIADLVFGFSDPELPSTGNTSWGDAKKAYLNQVKGLSNDQVFLVACEELHESAELLHDLKYQGSQVWKRYPVHGMEVFWYFKELLKIFHEKLVEPRYRPLVSEFASLVKSLKEIVLEGSVY
jgi:(p)ppGpp synthase/HD superfamily hydrolase